MVRGYSFLSRYNHVVPSRKRKVIALALGLACTLAVAEAALRLLGAASGGAGPEQGKAHLLCLGNSYTAGIGAPEGKSYCHQLRDLLAAGTAQPVTMVNLGRATLNSTQILATLDEDLAARSPRLVLAMVGEPNYWNLRGIGGRHHLLAWLQRLKLARLLSHLLLRPESGGAHRRFPLFKVKEEEELAAAWRTFLLARPPARIRALEGADLEEAERLLAPSMEDAYSSLALARLELYARGKSGRVPELAAGALRGNDPGLAHRARLDILAAGFTLPEPEDPEAARLAAWIDARYATSRDLDAHYRALPPKEKEKLEAALQRLVNGGFPSGHAALFLTNLHHARGQPAEALRLLAGYLSRYPFDEAFNPLVRLRQFSENPASREAVEEILRRHFASFPRQPREEARLVPPADIDAWVEADLLALSRKVREHGAELVLMTYPPNALDLSSRRVDTVIRKFAREHWARLFDTHAELAPLFAGEPRGAVFSSGGSPYDNHLTARGYGLLAERLRAYLAANGLVPTP